MITEVKLPELGENITSGDLLKLMVKAGDKISKDQSLLELETDKAAVEVPSPVEGTVQKVHVKEGQKIAVGQVIITVDENGNPTAIAQKPTEEPKSAPAPKSESKPSPTANESKSDSTPKTPAKKPAASSSGSQTIEVKLPELGENITSGDLLKILVKTGEKVQEGQALLEIETDKATVEVPSPADGTIKSVTVKEGQKLKVGQILATLETSGAAATAELQVAEPGDAEEGIAGVSAAGSHVPAAVRESAEAASQAAQHSDAATVQIPSTAVPQVAGYVAPGSHTGKSPIDVPAAPSARALAREIGVDITEVHGTGPGGRISRDDIKAHARRLATQGPVGSVGPRRPTLPDFAKWGSVERKPITGIRRKTAQHMEEAWAIPHVTNHDKADVSNLETLRKQFSASAEKAGGKLTMTAIAVKIVAAAIKNFPQFASSLDMSKEELIYKQYVHVGVAVDTERGLLVPVIRDADKKNIIQLSVELQQLAEKARARKLTPEEMEGSVFTITNLGGIGGTSFTPIINSPEVAILGMMRAAWEPVYSVGKFEPRLMMPLSLSYDHRVIDGADAARFLRWTCEAFEQPFLLSLRG